MENKIPDELAKQIYTESHKMYTEQQSCGYVAGAIKYAKQWQVAHELIKKISSLKDLWLPIDSSIQHEDECAALHALESDIANYLTTTNDTNT